MKKLLILTLALLLLVSFSISCNKNEDEFSLDTPKNSTPGDEFSSDTPENSTPEKSGKTIPVYEGMTISNEMPSTATMSISRLSAKKHVNQEDPFGKGGKGKHIKDEINEAFVAVDAAPTDYYAKPEQDIYITVHVNNPDNFEIQSFTLNGVKYASYMFEKGSDMENLILKYNVGTTEGAQEYTLDAIKYIDGESIKDALLDGDKTVKVNVTPKDQPSVEISGEAIGFTDLTTTVNLTDKNSLISNSDGKLYIVLYDGDKLTVNKEITAGNTITLEDLIPDTIYQYAIIGVYDAIDGSGKIGHVLYQKAFATEAVLVFEFDVIARLGTFGAKWGDGYDGEKNLTSFALYNDSGKIRDLSVGITKIEDLTVGDSVYMVAEYKIGDKTYTYTSEKVEVLSQNKSLVVSNGKIVGLMDYPYDTVLYLNMPISRDFAGLRNSTVKEIYFGEGVTEIDPYNLGTFFSGFVNLEKVVFVSENKLEKFPGFKNCTKLENITIPDSVRYIDFGALENTAYYNNESNWENGLLYCGKHLISVKQSLSGQCEVKAGTKSVANGAFYNCSNIESIILPDGLETLGEVYFNTCSSLRSIIIPQSLKGTLPSFSGCRNLESINIPNSITELPPNAFAACRSLETIYMSNSVKDLGVAPFVGCYSLKRIVFDGTKAEWRAIKYESLYGVTLAPDEPLPDVTVECNDGNIEI